MAPTARGSRIPGRLALATLLVLAALLGAGRADADLRTKTVRLVPDQAWQASPGKISLAVEVTAEGPEAEQFGTSLGDWVQKAFEKLDYTVSDGAPVEVRFTVDTFDKGKWVKRYLKGDGVVLGTITIRAGGKTVGSYRYSSRLRGGFVGTSINMMAKEVGPPLVLKLTKGEQDEALHGEE